MVVGVSLQSTSSAAAVLEFALTASKEGRRWAEFQQAVSTEVASNGRLASESIERALPEFVVDGRVILECVLLHGTTPLSGATPIVSFNVGAGVIGGSEDVDYVWRKVVLETQNRAVVNAARQLGVHGTVVLDSTGFPPYTATNSYVSKADCGIWRKHETVKGEQVSCSLSSHTLRAVFLY